MTLCGLLNNTLLLIDSPVHRYFFHMREYCFTVSDADINQLPKYVDGVDVFALLTVLVVDDAETDVDERHARFNVYCVKPEALNVVAVSFISVCTTQASAETSTATHECISRHRFRHSVSVVYGSSCPFSDATPFCLVHVSQPVKDTEITGVKA